MRSHTGEKPYECNNCKKKFVSKNSLKVKSLFGFIMSRI